ncbi:hypothetical protein EV1_022463 [Malus domestica]
MGGRDLSGERGRGSVVQPNVFPNCNSRAHIHGVTGCGNTQILKIPQSTIPTVLMSGIYSASPTITCHLKLASSLQKDSVPVSVAFPGRVRFTLVDRGFALSMAREVSTELAKTTDGFPSKKKRLVNDPYALWRRYIDWLYQHKELGLFLDVSQVGFTDEFVSKMEPQFQVVFKAMDELEKGTIANPDEGRMIENTLKALLKFSNDVISGKIKPPSSPEGRFTQFVAEELALDNPPLKIRSMKHGYRYGYGDTIRHDTQDTYILNVGYAYPSCQIRVNQPGYVSDEYPRVSGKYRIRSSIGYGIRDQTEVSVHHRIRFIDNTDPGGIDHQIVQLGPELASTLIIVISKSGGTPETINGLLERPLPLSVSMEAMIADPAPTTVDEHGNHDYGSGQQSSTIPLKNPRENKEMEWEKQKQKAKEDKKKADIIVVVMEKGIMGVTHRAGPAPATASCTCYPIIQPSAIPTFCSSFFE